MTPSSNESDDEEDVASDVRLGFLSRPNPDVQNLSDAPPKWLDYLRQYVVTLTCVMGAILTSIFSVNVVVPILLIFMAFVAFRVGE